MTTLRRATFMGRILESFPVRIDAGNLCAFVGPLVPLVLGLIGMMSHG